MATIDVVNTENKKVGTIDLNDKVFGVKVNEPLVHQILKAQLAGRRRGTAKTKNRGEIRGGGKKPFRQKGTGNARQGSSRSPLLVGGGVVHGPTPRTHKQGTTKKMAQGALRSMLTDRLVSERLKIVDEFKLAGHKTKDMAKISKALNLNQALVVDSDNKNLEMSGRNLPFIKVVRAEGLNLYDMIKHEWLVLTKSAVKTIEARLS